MSPRSVTAMSLAALAGAAMLTLSIGPVSAFTLSGPPLARSVASAQIERIWWDRWGRWHPERYYDDGPFGIVGAAGALAADAVVGSAEVVGDAVARPGYCWHRYYNRYEGWRWRRVC
jgi:hypothetical protein